ncbi:hypothetical protein ACLOJK_011813 [Asimina triloba]
MDRKANRMDDNSKEEEDNEVEEEEETEEEGEQTEIESQGERMKEEEATCAAGGRMVGARVGSGRDRERESRGNEDGHETTLPPWHPIFSHLSPRRHRSAIAGSRYGMAERSRQIQMPARLSNKTCDD